MCLTCPESCHAQHKSRRSWPSAHSPWEFLGARSKEIVIDALIYRKIERTIDINLGIYFYIYMCMYMYMVYMCLMFVCRMYMVYMYMMYILRYMYMYTYVYVCVHAYAYIDIQTHRHVNTLQPRARRATHLPEHQRQTS